ncbi:myosin-binding protein 2 isoform X2 [Dendrobium catenatum]|uniref:myosin-binding protein 2 isoform X2 n=1 Tax=Dendrobium catenatum TaxID=906689 RepID=UPI0009F4F2A3|nr:myosin-binding protein 2 isoform X2 [Dendrobium catenatum]
MAANKFATVVHRNTNRMIFLLIYTALEWILIILILLNALFSYMISKFASVFGLKPPCIFCSRIDHLFEPGKSRSSWCDFLCESHAGEVSKLGFCSNHRRLADAGDMCEDCAASKPGEADRSVPLLSWMKRSEQGEKDLRCSCCGVALESGFYSPYLLLKTESWNVLEFAPRDKSEKGQGFGFEETKQGKEQKEEEEEKGEAFLPSPRAVVEDASVDILSPRVEKMVDLERILPIELIDSSTMVKYQALEILIKVAENESTAVPCSEMQEGQNHSYILVPTEEPCDDFSTNAKNADVVEFEEQQASEDGKGKDEANCEISIGSDICDQELIEPPQSQSASIGHQNLNVLNETTHDDPVTETEPSEQPSRRAKHLRICPVLSEIEEERIMPETPTTPNYIESFPVLHKRFLLERRESGTESLDGSIASDIDNLEPPTIDRLKTALKSERRALIALYGELEEERSASAIAANQTMAMITRLQEEKAAMQMEALQYQRMMEEQSEYDQEALQLLNELMMKREKEKQELKKELEVYQHKVRAYETIERRKMPKGSRSGTSSSAEESDEISLESQEGEDGNQNSMEDDDAVNNLIILDKSLAEFEEERVAILEQLKALEEKLFTIDDEDDSFNSKHMKQLPIENGHGINGDCEYGFVNGSLDSLDANGCLDLDQKGGEIEGKRLLPLFDAISLENEDEPSINHKSLAISEEVDLVYERLQALEADREFLKHCMSSLKKGERGIDLLQEILLHLRDLRSVELRSRHIDA